MGNGRKRKYVVLFRLALGKADGTGPQRGDIIDIRAPGTPTTPKERMNLGILRIPMTEERKDEILAQRMRQRPEAPPPDGLNFTFVLDPKTGQMEKIIDKEADKAAGKAYHDDWKGYSKWGVKINTDILPPDILTAFDTPDVEVDGFDTTEDVFIFKGDNRAKVLPADSA